MPARNLKNFISPGPKEFRVQTHVNFSPESLGMIVASTDIQPSIRIGSTRFWKIIPRFLVMVKINRCSTLKNESYKWVIYYSGTIYSLILTVVSFANIKSGITDFVIFFEKWIKIWYWTRIFESWKKFRRMICWPISNKPLNIPIWMHQVCQFGISKSQTLLGTQKWLVHTNLLVTTIICWWRFWPFWLLTPTFFLNQSRAPPFKRCHQHRNSVTNFKSRISLSVS